MTGGGVGGVVGAVLGCRAWLLVARAAGERV
jgi:hypothetical protein